MIAGFGGDLVSHAYVEALLADRAADAEPDAQFARALVRWWRQVSSSLGPASSARAVMEIAVAPLLQLLELERPAMSPFPNGFAGGMTTASAVVIVLPWASTPATAWRDVVLHGMRTRSEWALLCNGRSLRIVDCTRTWMRGGIDFDFERLTVNPAGIAALRLLAGGPALGGPLRARVLESDAHATRVCRTLGDSVLAALPRLADALARSPATRRERAAAFDQALTLVYRILFLLFAEARALVPVWHELYRDAYTIEALARKAATARTPGLWAALQAISRLAHAGCKAGDLEVTAFNGRLFSPRHAPLVDQRRVPDAVVRDVLLSLATEPSRRGRVRVSYHDLGVEQLGSVYERVLEYQPASDRDAPLARTSIERKATGSFYTPRSMTEFLVRRTLSPLVSERTADEILGLRILDPAMGSGAFLVAACRFLADQCERALIAEGRWLEADVSADDRATLRRQVAERCLYGVDLNPTAVQLARVSLWLTTLAADRPLTFLDHHLAAGNSLIGARLADLSQAPGRGSKPRAPLPLFDDQAAEAVSTNVLPARWRLALEPSDSPDIVRNKERSLALLAEDALLSRWHAAADAWCAAALWPGAPPAPGVVAEWMAAATGGATTLSHRQLRASLGRAREIAASHGVFHWELAFPEVFFDGQGRLKAGAGFDAVIGNPPWDMLRADIGSANDRADARAAARAALRFFRVSSLYRRQGGGHPNRYQLFLERALDLARPGGRIGLILPSGIATDHGSAFLRRALLDETTVDTWLGFDNRHRIFPIHRSVRFVVLATTNGGATGTLRFRCGITDPGVLDREHEGETLAVSRSRLHEWNPEHLTIPEVPDSTALGLIASIAGRIPALGDPAGWHARFGRELNATDDRPNFKRLAGARGLLPIVEGKQLAPFQIDLSRSTLGIPRQTAATLLDRATFERDRIAYRDVASATNKVTLIAAMLPRGTISTHTVFCLKTPLTEDEQWCLLGLLNSLVANYLVRLQVTTHVTTALMARLPVPRPQDDSIVFKTLVKLSRQLASSGIDGDAAAYAEVNAIAAHLYGLAGDQFAYILNTFPLIAESTRRLCWTEYVRAHGNTEARNG